jgi:hypothetical protein
VKEISTRLSNDWEVSSVSNALTEVVAGLISRKVSRNKHTPESLKHTSAIKKHDIFLEHVSLKPEYDSPELEHIAPRRELKFLL